MSLQRIIIRGLSVLVMGAAVTMPRQTASAAPAPCPVNTIFCANSCAMVCPPSCYQQSCYVFPCEDGGEQPKPYSITCQV